MRLNKYCVFWSDDDGVGKLINFVDNSYKLYIIPKNIMQDFFGEEDIDVKLNDYMTLWEPVDVKYYKDSIHDFIIQYVEPNIEPQEMKIYFSGVKNEFFYYQNNKKFVLYNGEDMKFRMFDNWRKKYNIS